MTREESKLEILKKVENGTLTVEEGSDLLGILENAEGEKGNTTIPNPIPESPEKRREVSGCWKAAWSMVLVAGALLIGFSANWIYQSYSRNGLGWGFWLSWIPLIIGLLLAIFGWALMDSPWMRLGVHHKDQKEEVILDIEIPVPFNLATWFFRNFGNWMPEGVHSAEILEILSQAERSIKGGEPFSLQVDDEKDGSKVEIFINDK